MKTESTHLTIQQVRGATKFWALFAKYYDFFLKAHDVDGLKKLYVKLKSKITNPKAKEAIDFFYRVRRDVILGYIKLNEITQFLEENKMIKEYSNQTGVKSALLKHKEFPTILDDKTLKWIGSKEVKIFMDGRFMIFTDGKLELVTTNKSPFKVLRKLKKATPETKKQYSLNEFSAKSHGDKKQTWKFKSGSSNKTYETVKWGDGSYSCNCPGWTRRVNSKKERLCKHVKQVGGKPYRDVPQNEEKLREMIRKMIQEMKVRHKIQESINEVVDGQFNKKVSKLLDVELKDIKKGSPDHQWFVKEAFKAALTDSNFHTESKKVDSLFGRAKLGSYSWKNRLTGNEISFAGKEKHFEDEMRDVGIKISKMAKWDGYKIIDAFAFYSAMKFGSPFHSKITALKEDI